MGKGSCLLHVHLQLLSYFPAECTFERKKESKKERKKKKILKKKKIQSYMHIG